MALNVGEIQVTLTARDQLAATLKEASDQVRKFGDQAESSASQAETSFISLAGAIAGGIGLQQLTSQLIGFVKEVADTAGQLNDLNQVTDFSIGLLQNLQVATEQVGGSLDGVANGLEMLQQRLGEGNSGAIGALKELGINFKAFVGESQDDKVLDLANAFAAIEDPVQRAGIAAELFGRQWKTMLPTLLQLADDAKYDVTTMSDTSVKALDALGDAWSRFVRSVKNAAGEELGKVASDVLQLISLYRIAAATIPNWGAAVEDTTKAVDAQSKAIMRSLDATKAYGNVEAGLPLQAMSVETAIRKSNQAFKEEEDARKKAADAAKKHNEEMERSYAAFHKLVVEGENYNNILRAVAKVTYDLTPQLVPPFQSLDVVLSSTKDIVNYLAHDGLPNLAKELHPPVDEWAKFDSIIGGIADALSALGHAGFEAGREIGQSLNAAIQIINQFNKINGTNGLKGSQKTLANLGMLGTGAAGSAGAIQSGNVTQGILSGAETGAGIAGLAGMSVAAGAATMGIGAAVVGGIALYKHLTASAGRDLVKQFAASMGGFDELHKKLGELTASGIADGEKLWVALTQGVGKNNPQQAKKAIDDITAALDKQQQVLDQIVSGFGDMEDAASGMGATVPKELDDVVQQLLAIGDTKDAQSGLDELTAAVKKYQDQVAQTEAFKTIEQEAKDLGLTIDDMNGKFRQAADEEAARKIAKEFGDLAPYVNDVNVLADKFLGQIEQMVVDSETYGTAIPESMKPVIQSLIDQGKLLDANGTVITDMSQFNFEQDPLAKGLEELNQTLLDILHTLQNDLPHAFDGVRDAGVDAANHIDDAFNNIGGFGGLGDLGRVPHMAAGGIVTRPTLALIGENGPEMVTPLSGNSGGGGGYNGPATVTVNVGGQPFITLDMVKIAAARGHLQIPARAVTNQVPGR